LVEGVAGADVMIGEECHIVGENKGASRYVENFPDREGYSNKILLCRNHHKCIDTPELLGEFPVEVLLAMKAEHERAIAKQQGGPEPAPLRIKDSSFEANVKNAQKASAMEVNIPVVMQNVMAKLTAENVRDAAAFRTNQGLVGCLTSCPGCGKIIQIAHTGMQPVSFNCPHCGHRMEA
jgi:hypothetical protein